MAYATVEELAAALGIRLTAENTPGLQFCLDAAAVEIDHAVDRVDPIPTDDPLAKLVNINRAVEWKKSNDAAFGAIGTVETGVLQVPRGSFHDHAEKLTPLKQTWAIG